MIYLDCGLVAGLYLVEVGDVYLVVWFWLSCIMRMVVLWMLFIEFVVVMFICVLRVSL